MWLSMMLVSLAAVDVYDDVAVAMWLMLMLLFGDFVFYVLAAAVW